MEMKLQACTMRAIAGALHTSPSTISHELRRNGWQGQAEQCIAGGYDAQRASKRARRVRRAAWPVRKRYRDGALWAQIRALLPLRLSPEQIAAKLRLRYPEQPQLQASHETIYSAIYAMPQGYLRRDLTVLLRQARTARRPPTVARTGAARWRT